MNTEQSLVSILLPVHNAEKYLPLCLQSLFAQTHQNIEIIAIDDNSTDNSYKILKAFRKQDKRLRVYRNVKRYGMAITLNRCVKKSKASLIAFMDPHDSALPKRIEEQVVYLKDHPKIAAVGTQVVYVGKNNKKVSESAFPSDHESIYSKLLHGLSMQFETAMVDKHRLPKDMLYFKVNAYPYIFTEMFLKLSQYGQIANLMHALHMHRPKQRRHAKTVNGFEQVLYTAKTWFNAFAAPGDTPSLRSIFSPLLRA